VHIFPLLRSKCTTANVVLELGTVHRDSLVIAISDPRFELKEIFSVVDRQLVTYVSGEVERRDC